MGAMVMPKTDEENKESLRREAWTDRIRKSLATAIGYLIPLVMSAPGFYAGIMTLPFLFFLLRTFAAPEAIFYLFFGGSVLEYIVQAVGLVIVIYSLVFLLCNRSKGLVSSGPYRIARHPQYLGLILFTAVLTSRSVWVLTHTFGIGFLSYQETLVSWFLMVLAYFGLAIFEEHHLRSEYQAEWTEYRGNVGFLIPLIRNKRRWAEILGTFAVLAGLMAVLLISNGTLLWFT
jgi:protein-S-isoprenylcysteine O-methyltransferase Ste14